MSTRDEARAAKNKFMESLGGSSMLLDHGIGGIGVSGDKGQWCVRVLLTDRGGSTHVPESLDGVPFFSQYVSRLRALKEREE